MPGSDYVQTAWANGTSPAINAANLLNIEGKLGELDEQLGRSQVIALKDYLRYFINRSVKEVEGFEDYTEFTASGSTLSDDDTNTLHHTAGLKILEPDNSSSWVSAYKTISSIDLTSYNSSDSDTDGIILFVIYVSDDTYVDYVQLKLGDDNTDNYSIAYYVDTGWNFFTPNRSDFSTNNSPSGWDDITYIRCEWLSLANGQNEYITFDIVELIRPDSTYTYIPHPFNLDDGSDNWDNEIFIPYSYFSLYYDKYINKIGMQALDQDASTKTQLHLYCSIINFVCKFDWLITVEDELSSMVWYVDSDNYIEVYIDNARLYIYANESGSPTSNYTDLGYIEKGEEVFIYFEKYGSQIRVILKADYLGIFMIEYETSITDEGCIYLGSNSSSSFGLLTDFVLGHQQALKTTLESKIVKLIKKASSTSRTSTTISEDYELEANLDSYGIYRIELVLNVLGASNTTIKFDWSLIGVSMYSNRNSRGMAVGDTVISDCNIRTSCHAYTTDLTCGVSTSTSFITEDFLVETNVDVGSITFRWASNDGTSVTVTNQSYIIITKLN